MALTKTASTPHDWNAVAQNTIEVSSEFDVSAGYDSGIIIQGALDSVTAHTGTQFKVQVNPNESDDEDWADLPGGAFIELIGTAKTENLTNNPLAADSETMTMADTEGFETYGTDIDEIPGWRFIEDGTPANCELVEQISYVADTSIAWSGGTKNSHAQNTPVWNIAFSKPIPIPFWVKRVRVICNNTYDSDGSTLYYRVVGGRVTTLT
jgi:hypothetical protein